MSNQPATRLILISQASFHKIRTEIDVMQDIFAAL